MGDCEDFWAEQVLEFLVSILYPEKPTRITVTVGNTIFRALLGERPIDWGLLLSDVVGRMVGFVGKGKETMVYPYMFHLYKEHQVLSSSELVAYALGIEMIKYNCIPDPKPTPTTSKSETETCQPTPTLEGRKKRKTSSNKQENFVPIVEIKSEEVGPSQSEVEKNAWAFDNTNSWIKVAKENFDAMGQIVKDEAKALDITNI